MLRRLRWSLGRRRESRSQEGVYTAPERALHYVLEDGERTLCGRSVRELGLHRWASQWSLTEPDDRCRRCDALVGPRGAERHGRTTETDVLVFGLAPPWLSPAELDAFRAEHARDAARFRSVPPPEGVTFRDPPFELATDPNRIRGLFEPSTDRVVNEVYARVRPGLRWHRIINYSKRSEHAYYEMYGRIFVGACTYGVREFEPNPKTKAFEPSQVSTDRPPDGELCLACRKALEPATGRRRGPVPGGPPRA